MLKNNPKPTALGDRIRATRNFDYGTELAALEAQHKDGGLPLLMAIIEVKILPKDEACRLYADTLGVADVDPFASVITDEAVAALPVEIARKAKVLGLYIIEGVLTAAFGAPNDTDLVKRISQIAQMPVSPVFALPREIEDAMLIQYSSEKNLEESLNELERSSLFDQPDAAADRLAALADSESLVQIHDEIIYCTIRERATDIHIEPQETQSRVRFRIDGMLREVLTYSRKLHRAFVSRLKILCQLNIAETRFPQDGRFSMPVGTSTANFRFSSLPSQYGEKVVIRILACTSKRSMLTLRQTV